MAILDPNALPVTGTIGNLTYYRIKGSDKIYVRRKGGVSKKRIKKAPEFERTRENNAEFSGCAKAVANIRDIIYPIHRLADFNFTPKLIALMKKIQRECDTGHRGERNIRITRYHYLLEGFAFNRYFPFTGIVRQPLHAVIDRERGTATIDVPALRADINLFVPWKSPYYQLIFCFGAVDDLMFDGSEFPYGPRKGREMKETAWSPVVKPSRRQTITLQLPNAVKENETLILTVGVQMGSPDEDGEVAPVARQGAGMILRVG